MLVSMTYHAVLFAGVVLGLVLGHAWFNAAAPLGSRGGASACCQHVAAVALVEDGLDPDKEDEQRDDGSARSRGSADDHSSQDSLNKDLLARRGARRGLEMGDVVPGGPESV